MAERGATVLLHGRTAQEALAAAGGLAATAGIDAPQLRAFGADFARLDEVESLARKVVAEHPHLDVLVNNAAIAAPERHTVTADGNEIAFQVNFLAHYLLTCLLEPALTSDPGGRVVDVPSALHRTASSTAPTTTARCASSRPRPRPRTARSGAQQAGGPAGRPHCLNAVPSQWS
ncbi:SDR family NAD(P)-dependent oxidoreductase [Streptomyces sp. NPDC001388]|uniref:SDR family NAD(P)-dependent oxidoreductase n=1 Tax=Streptomyces sp. NPDC001388 TaxID=3364568 RepID=UPI0036C92F51